MSKNKVIVMGGGTFSDVRTHFALSALAFGHTAHQLHHMLTERLSDYDVRLMLTKMAGGDLITNEDVADAIDKLCEDETVKCIVCSIAFCDWQAVIPDRGRKGTRLQTSSGHLQLNLVPTEKVIDRIRRKRPDIFLVGFKATTGYDHPAMFETALKMMKRSKCNLVFANDMVTEKHHVVVPEESYYLGEYGNDDRKSVLLKLVELIDARLDLTYHRTNHIQQSNTSVKLLRGCMWPVLSRVIDAGGYICNNGNGFTPGHFCQRVTDNSFLSSQRKADHNLVEENGLSLVTVTPDGQFEVRGTRKASVGATSQWMMLTRYPHMDCIIHTHNPMRKDSNMPVVPQWPYQCGSDQCGNNTVNGLREIAPDVYGVFLEKHGANFLFSSQLDPDYVFDVIQSNVVFGTKVC